MIPGVSVVICTYNGAKLLPETLRHLAFQKVRPNIPWEVILVNNASTDNTPEVAEQEWESYHVPVPFSLLHQPKPGLTFARELALQNARFEFVLFCDDDNWLNPNYINLAYDLMAQHPKIGVLGGHGNLVFETIPPSWVQHHRMFASGAQSNISGKVNQNVVYGAGCIIRRSALNLLTQAGFRSLLTDRQGKSLSAGGDFELCLALALAGYDIWYDSGLTFSHFIPEKRLTWEYHKKLIEDGSKSFEALIPYRVRVNLGAKSTAAFHLKTGSVLASYFFKLIPELLKSPFLKTGSSTAKQNQLSILGLKFKILSFRNYNKMLTNFKQIIKFEQEQLKPFLKTKTSFNQSEVIYQ